MLSKRTSTHSVLSSALGLLSLCGCSLQDYDYLGAGNKPADETSEPRQESSSDTTTSEVTSSTEVQTTDEPDASVSSDMTSTGEPSSDISSEPTTSATSSEPTSETTSAPTSSSATSTSEPTSMEPLPPLVVEGNLLTNSSFESGVSPWVPFGNAVLVHSIEVAHTGEASLLTAGRNSGTYQSASIPLMALLEEGKSYRMKVWVRTTTAASTGFSVTAKAPCVPDGGTIDTNNNANYIQLGSGLARKDRWSEVTSNVFELPTCNLAEFTIYFDGPPLAEEYYIDDVSLVEVTP